MFVNMFAYRSSNAHMRSSPGFGITLVAETTTGCYIGADASAQPGEPAAPEEMGKLMAHRLLNEISGVCVSCVRVCVTGHCHFYYHNVPCATSLAFLNTLTLNVNIQYERNTQMICGKY